MPIRSTHLYQFVALVTAVFCIFSTSCKGEESGSLQLSFQLGSGKSCDEFEIEEVKAVLYNDGDDYDERVSCDKGEIRFNDVAPATYTLKLFGYSSNNKPIMDSKPEETTIRSAETTTIETPIPLYDAPAKLLIGWDFDFSDCEKSGIGGFYITAYNSDGNDDLFEEKKDIPCDFEPYEEDDKYHLIPDEERDLTGDDFGEVKIEPYDVNSALLGDPIEFAFDSPGPAGVIRLSLYCDDTGCTGSGEPDDD